MAHLSEKRYPVNPKGYTIYEEIGMGVSATVYRALCILFNEIVAVKVLDLEKCSNGFDDIRREVQTMSLIEHPNLVHAYCSFTVGQSLWVVMPFMAGGSCLHIMKYAYPEGFEGQIIAILLHEVLKALVYLHGHGHIHRDVKAGNILLDAYGAVKLADFGVSACMFETGDRQRVRNTFVGTPCWMAPEVLQQLSGYDFKADIWSFGITALELAHGHAPFSKYPPMKVLLMTLQNAPPGLDYERDKLFPKSFKDLVATCLAKDPKKRPTAEKLLKHSFFKHACSNNYLVKSILGGLAPLGDRFKKLKAQEADCLIQNKALYENIEHLSQQEYVKGMSTWNFNLDDLKRQVSMGLGTVDKSQGLCKGDCEVDCLSSQTFNDSNSHSKNNSIAKSAATMEDTLHEFQKFEGSFPSLLQALKGYFDVCEDDTSSSSPDWSNVGHSSPVNESVPVQKQLLQSVDSEGDVPKKLKKFSGSFLSESGISPCKNVSDDKNRDVITQVKHRSLRHYSGPLTFGGSFLSESEISPCINDSADKNNDVITQVKHRSLRNYSGPLTFRQNRDGYCEPFASTFQQRGRFKITSEDPIPKVICSTNCMASSLSGLHTSARETSYSPYSLFIFMLQQNAIQREQLSKLIGYMDQTSCHQKESIALGSNWQSQLSHVSGTENVLLSYVELLQKRIRNLEEEIQNVKIQNAQLEHNLINGHSDMNNNQAYHKE